MLHVASAFESSLRGRDFSSPAPKKATQAHSSCKGVAHGTGNYCASTDKEGDLGKSPFQRSSSGRWSRKSIGRSSAKVEQKTNSSQSSENCSESDSLDSLGNKTKSSDVTDDVIKKSDSVCSRLFKTVTKSSVAKTAKMRHLDIFDVDESSWVGGLRKTNADDGDKALKKVGGFVGSRNGSIRRQSDASSVEVQENEGKTGLARGGSLRRSDKQKGFNKTLGRGSFRISFNNKKLSKIKTVDYDEISFMSNIKKTIGFFSTFDLNNCFKDLNEVLQDVVS